MISYIKKIFYDNNIETFGNTKILESMFNVNNHNMAILHGLWIRDKIETHELVKKYLLKKWV